jgi:macrophage erythroblast attacher
MSFNLSRQTFKSAQRAIEHASKNVLADFKAAQQSASKSSPEKTFNDIDGMISRMSTLKRKLESLHEEEQKYNRASRVRIEHLQTLYDVQSLVDVKYDEWSRTRLSRLLVDYLLRSGYVNSASALAKAKGIEDLVDIDAFMAAEKIDRSLRQNHNPTVALNWCKENEKALQKMDPTMELQYELRLQQYIEMLRAGHEKTRMWDEAAMAPPHGTALRQSEQLLAEARIHARKYLAGEAGSKRFNTVAGLLAYRPWVEVEPYAVSPHYRSYNKQCTDKRCLVTLLNFTLGRTRRPLHHNAPQAFFPPASPSPPHRP